LEFPQLGGFAPRPPAWGFAITLPREKILALRLRSRKPTFSNVLVLAHLYIGCSSLIFHFFVCDVRNHGIPATHGKVGSTADLITRFRFPRAFARTMLHPVLSCCGRGRSRRHMEKHHTTIRFTAENCRKCTLPVSRFCVFSVVLQQVKMAARCACDGRRFYCQVRRDLNHALE